MIPSMIPPDRIDSTLRELSEWKNPLDDEPMGAGPLTGALSSTTRILLAGVMGLFASAFLFAAAYVMGDNSITPLTASGNDNVVRALWIFGWLFLLAGIAVLLIGAYARSEKKAAVEELMFKTEPRDFDLDHFDQSKTVEVVKVRCRYCGTLNDASAKNCVACGGTM